MRIPLHGDVEVLAVHASGLVALGKPAGIMTHPNKPGPCKNALLTVPYDFDDESYSWVNPDGKIEKLWILNRLDSPTSGIVIASVRLKTAEWVRDAFRERRVRKVYLAAVRGWSFTQPAGTWRDQLAKQRDNGGFVRSRNDAQGKSAVTHFKCLKANRQLDLALIELHPETGLTHQLRVQCANRAHPILGDKTYGDFKFNRDIKSRTGFNRLALHAVHIEIPLPDGSAFTASAPLPEDISVLF